MEQEVPLEKAFLKIREQEGERESLLNVRERAYFSTCSPL